MPLWLIFYNREVTNMKRLLKKLAAIVTMAAVTLTMTVAIPTPASADSIYDTAKAISSGKQVSTTLYSDGDCADYKINVTKSGTLKIIYSAQIESSNIYLFDENGSIISPSERNSTAGSIGFNKSTHPYVYCTWDSTFEIVKGNISYPVKKGDYYIRFERDKTGWAIKGNGKLTFTATYPSSTSTTKINYITINLPKGSTLSLGADTTGYGSVTWKSSKSSVATVSSAGKVTAKAKGSTIITAKSGKSSKKIKIVVT